jgi:mRNA-degrading endonuclease RelE of RelBE toxin-antitoxin system
MVKVVFAEHFKRVVSKIKDASVREQLEKLIYKIAGSPETGKPMRYDRKGTREVYAGSFRLSYLYDQKTETLYLLDIYHKDKQ